MGRAESLPIQAAPQPDAALSGSASTLPGLGEIERALAMLLESKRSGPMVRRSSWQFAVKIEQLWAAGITNNALRYLVCVRFAEHSVEVTPPKSSRRRFRKLHNLMMPDNTCFVVTELGVKAAPKTGAKSD